jgi:hypothetical protein
MELGLEKPNTTDKVSEIRYQISEIRIMARYTGPKQRLQRQIGEDLSLKTNGLKTAKRIASRPGQHGAKNRRKLSNFGVQLKEKQKLQPVPLC